MPSALVDNSLFMDFDDPIERCDTNGNMIIGDQATLLQHSKCVNDYGELFVVYHAANEDFATFDKNRIGSGGGGIMGKGFYFSGDPDNISIYGKYIKSFYLNFKNPYIYEEADDDTAILANIDIFIEDVLEPNGFEVSDGLRDKITDVMLNESGGLDSLIELTCTEENATDFFKRCGFDGIMNLDTLEFVAYEPDQIIPIRNRKVA